MSTGSALGPKSLVPVWYHVSYSRRMAMTLRLTDELTERVRLQAECEHTSMQSLVVRATQEYVDRHSRGAAIDAAMEKIKGRYGDVLRRLGE